MGRSDCSSHGVATRHIRGANRVDKRRIEVIVPKRDASEQVKDGTSTLQSTNRAIQVDQDENDSREVPKRPLHYWDDIRTSNIPFETSPGSAMFKLRTVQNDTETTVRLAHIANIFPYSETLSDGTRIPNESLIYIEAGMFLAVLAFNERSSTELPDLPDRLKGCNVYITMDILDTILSPITASEKALSVLNRPPASLDNPFPISLAGAFRSAVSQPLATLSGVYNVPHVNGQSTSSVLDNKDQAPTFVRVVPTNGLDAMAYTYYLKSLKVHHFAVLHVRDAYGTEFNRDLRVAAAENEMHMMSVSYHDGDNGSIDRALDALKRHNHRYIFVVPTPSAGTLKYIVRQAINLDMIGNQNHFWMWSEAVTALLEPGFYETNLDSSLESDREIASALSGTGLVLLEIEENDEFTKSMQELRSNTELYEYFVSKHDEPRMFDDFKFNPAANFYQSLSFDAIMALGIGLCDLPQEFPNGTEIVEAIKTTEFVGVSGPVSFDNFTGTRAADGLNFKVVNLIVEPSEEAIVYEARTSSLVNMSSGQVDVIIPFVYSHGTLAPPQLPPAVVDMNLLDTRVQSLGWTLSGLTIFVSFVFATWTWKHKKRNIVRAAQPIFLVLLCFGTTLMASAIIPLSLQEPVSNLNAACMAAPWLFVLGYATAVGSVCCKLIRINKVFQHSASMHRVQVKARDLFLPFAFYVLTNVAILLSWTLVAPLRWTRVATGNVDAYDRSIESYGTCVADPQDGKYTARTAFAVALLIFNFVAVLYANWQSYLSRHLPSSFNETTYLGISMVGVLEGFLIGAPMLFFAVDDPTATFVVVSILITFICLAFLLPTFVSKLVMRRRAQTVDGTEWRDVWNKIDSRDNKRRRSSNSVSNHGGDDNHKSGSHDTVDEIRRRVAEKAKQESARSERSAGQSSGRDASTVEDSRVRASLLTRKDSSRMRIKRT